MIKLIIIYVFAAIIFTMTGSTILGDLSDDLKKSELCRTSAKMAIMYADPCIEYYTFCLSNTKENSTETINNLNNPDSFNRCTVCNNTGYSQDFNIVAPSCKDHILTNTCVSVTLLLITLAKNCTQDWDFNITTGLNRYGQEIINNYLGQRPNNGSPNSRCNSNLYVPRTLPSFCSANNSTC